MTKRIIFLFAFLVFISSAVYASNDYLHSAYWRPDGKGYIAGAIHIYLKNPTRSPLRIKEIKLDNNSIGLLVNEDIIKNPIEFRKRYIKVINKRVLWYRVCPNPIPSEGISEIIIRLVKKPSFLSSKIEIITSLENINFELKYRNPAFSLSYVAFSPELKEVYVYLRKFTNNEVSISKVFWDGKEIMDKAYIPSKKFFHQSLFIKLKLDNPLAEGSFHTITVETKEGEKTASLIRVIPPFFAIGAWSAPSSEEMASHLCNWVMGGRDRDSLAKYGLKCSPKAQYYIHDYEKETKEKVYFTDPRFPASQKDNPTLYCYYLEDEPDGRSGCSGSVPKDVARAHELLGADGPFWLSGEFLSVWGDC
jgi:hypothetical protein